MFLAENVENYYKKHIPSKGKDVYGWSSFNIGAYKDNELIHPDKLPNIKDVDGMIRLICKLLNVPCNPKIIPKPKNFIEIPDQYNDSTKLKNLGFSCKVNLEKGIENTIKWYKTHQKLFKKIGYSYFI
jgi:nucleoside-diphosphate-sugar epimerase